MASPQPTDSHTRISNELYNQILMRDFTKRQRAILDLLLRLSYGCGKKTAYIPQMRHFEACGVAPNKVKRELDALQLYNVVGWDTGSHEFWLNKDYDTWQIGSPSDDQKDTFAELLRINLKAIDAQNGRRSDQNGHDQNGQDDQKGQPEPPKMGGENGPKRSSEEAEIPCGTRPPEPPITIDNYKDIKDQNIVGVEERARTPDVNDYLVQVMKFGRDVFPPYGISHSTSYRLAELLVKEELPVELAGEALKVSKALRDNEGFSATKLLRWLQSGIKDVEAARRYESEKFGSGIETVVGGGLHVQYSRHSRASPSTSSDQEDDYITKLVERT